ncbi:MULTISPECIES: alpha/beta fold hydrolase [Nitrospirillum]|uniref:Pimeloyl-ACP methyl ester carboxylesterase n=1 Tax=Nitrospirillum amazonense TaxID=28077 RepID=A0A560F6W1_9PROT|nr:alpha/beta fold hydrolase [Nitrospirillum amazonense]MEC4593082.1 alpha/beta fold hydrolase [Nitrospirillum amazonense]TWB17361.1 pimeloyl-ACP methyl ester carboxylesterase [Nitrospirillum amazonense]
MQPFNADRFWQRFRHGLVTANGVRLHYVEGGPEGEQQGPPVLLIPGWPQSWYAWRHVMPLLADAGRRVIAVDPRGFGDSDRPAGGYDLGTVAADMHGLADVLGLLEAGPLDVVGHDVGTWIGHAYAADWPGDVRRLALVDAALPGITPPPPPGIPSDEANARTWHFAFNRLDDLPELLIQGRERAYLGHLFNAKALRRWAIGPADLDEYVRVLSLPGALRSTFAYYREVFRPAELARAKARAAMGLTLPILALGARAGVGTLLADTLRGHAADLRAQVLDCGHYVPEEAPDELAAVLVDFLAG